MNEFSADYLIPEENLAGLEEAIAGLNKRAAKLGCVAIEFCSEFSHQMRLYKDHEKRCWVKEGEKAPENYEFTGTISRWFKVTVTGETPHYAGWSLVAILQHLVADDCEKVEVIRAVPGHTVPVEFRGRGTVCDHCGTLRRRNDTFIVRHEDGTCKQVGRSCLGDFLGHADPHQIASAAEFFVRLGTICSEFEDEREAGGRCRYSSLDHYLAWVATVIRTCGWLSRGKARETFKMATADYAMSLMCNPRTQYEFIREFGRPSEEDEATVTDVIAWARSLSDREELNDYLYSLNAIARAGIVDDRSLGIAASMIVACRFDRDKQAEAAREKTEAAKNQHFGTVGERAEFTLTLIGEPQPIEGEFGTTWIHRFRDETGNYATWFGSNNNLGMEVGEAKRLKATVKKHDIYHGMAQTILSRVAIAPAPKAKKARSRK